MKLYLQSQGRYGDSPFLYPIYGLGGLPEAFSRLCAIHGGTFMLSKNVDEITFDDDVRLQELDVEMRQQLLHLLFAIQHMLQTNS